MANKLGKRKRRERAAQTLVAAAVHELGHAMAAERYGIPWLCAVAADGAGVCVKGRAPRKEWQRRVVALAGGAAAVHGVRCGVFGKPPRPDTRRPPRARTYAEALGPLLSDSDKRKGARDERAAHVAATIVERSWPRILELAAELITKRITGDKTLLPTLYEAEPAARAWVRAGEPQTEKEREDEREKRSRITGRIGSNPRTFYGPTQSH